MAPHTPPPSLSLQLAEFTIASVAIVVMSLAPIRIPICIFSFPGGFPLFLSSPYYVREKKEKGIGLARNTGEEAEGGELLVKACASKNTLALQAVP